MVTLLVLWDIDHTLVENAGVSKQIYAAAYAALTGKPPRFTAPTEGRTDPAVMRALFGLHGVPMPSWQHVEAALVQAGAQHFETLQLRGSALPGVCDVLRELSGRRAVAQSVLTGNIRPNAYVKLSAFSLEVFVDLGIGAYGSDAEVRADLVAIAQQRFREVRGSAPRRVVLVGDTPRDVEAAHDGGVEILAVASGIHGIQELRAAGAERVLPDLTDTRAVLAALGVDG
jgi:phosphoglycolate phosphatase-like HAD superfamily hydrolase